ncbi:MAG: 30S ribosomal protein S6e [Thaumarchaeota archaeon]|nr:30S ribosomal protein S6e [Nitrososphaerota archaeon]
MASFKVVVSDPSSGKSEVIEAKDSQAQIFMGRKIGEIIDLSLIGQNYKVKLTGGSDKAGFPMRRDVMGSGKRYVLMTKGVGFRHPVEGEKRRKLVRGGTVTEEVYQLNVARTEPTSETKNEAAVKTVAAQPTPA